MTGCSSVHYIPSVHKNSLLYFYGTSLLRCPVNRTLPTSSALGRVMASKITQLQKRRTCFRQPPSQRHLRRMRCDERRKLTRTSEPDAVAVSHPSTCNRLTYATLSRLPLRYYRTVTNAHAHTHIYIHNAILQLSAPTSHSQLHQHLEHELGVPANSDE